MPAPPWDGTASLQPPQIISLAKPVAPGASVQRRWLITLPTDQLKQAAAIARRPCGDAPKPAPCVSIKIPIRPTAMPAASSLEGYTFQAMLIAVIIIGTTAMKATTSPDSTDCSA